MANYILTNKAVEDLSNIWNDSFEVWSEYQPDKYNYMLLDSCQDLADEKVFGKKYEAISENILGFRIGQHIIFYRKLKEKKIEIARVLHHRMDLRNRAQE